IEFVEGWACIGGCVGGCLTVENNFVARMVIDVRARGESGGQFETTPKIRCATEDGLIADGLRRKHPLQSREFKPLDEDFSRSMEKMQQIEILEQRLPGLDCGSCGAPGCRALAEDIVTGHAREIDCVFVLKDRVLELSKLTSEMLQMGHPMEKNGEGEQNDEG
ncbi:MAG: (Fe-S)-binding protein, partial [Eubacterium sp.]